MEKLRLVSVTDADELVLMAGDGRQFTVDVDDELRDAVRRTRRPPMTRPEAAPQRPGPREVQARIRSGESAEEVAERTGLDLDYVRRFEGPVVAERAHVASLARASQVERDAAGRSITLEESVSDAVAAEGFDPAAILWDSRRVEGSRWDVLARHDGDAAPSAAAPPPRSAPLTATWRYDTATRSLEPLDADAARLSGPPRPRRLTAVREDVFDVEQAARHGSRAGGTTELLDALARQRGRRPVRRGAEPEHEPEERVERAVTRWRPEAVHDGPGSERPESERTGSERTGSERTGPRPGRQAARPGREVSRDGADEFEDEPAEQSAARREPERPAAGGRTAAPGRRRRPSVELGPDVEREPVAMDDYPEPGEPPAQAAPEYGAGEPARQHGRRTVEPYRPDRDDVSVEDGAPTVPSTAARADAARSREQAGRQPPAGSLLDDDLEPLTEPAPASTPTPRPAPTGTAEERAAGRPSSRARQRRRRATVPSWDDIVFGARREDE